MVCNLLTLFGGEEWFQAGHGFLKLRALKAVHRRLDGMQGDIPAELFQERHHGDQLFPVLDVAHSGVRQTAGEPSAALAGVPEHQSRLRPASPSAS